MEFTAPSVSVFTIYGKTGCPYCDKVKAFLDECDQEFTYVNCDEYLLADRDAFLEFIRTAAGKEYKTFPMVFSPKGFVGGYTETLRLLLDA